MSKTLQIEEFLSAPGQIIDVRSPSEYNQGHIPNSHLIPIFNDHERALIGTAYKQQGREVAIDLGMDLLGPHLRSIVQRSRQLLNNNMAKVLCWRGGMRSGIIANLFNSLGMDTVKLEGGYKTFRRKVLNIYESMPSAIPKFRVLGGLTGSSKTEILHELKAHGEQIIDLEGCANHRGSAFGGLGMPPQVSNEQFENIVAYNWSQLDLDKPIWIEDESRLIGKCYLPTPLFNLIQNSPLICIQRPYEERLDKFIATYGVAPSSELIEATNKLRRRLGSQLTDEVISHFKNNNVREASIKLLSYYDKAYNYQLSNRSQVSLIDGKNKTAREWAHDLIRFNF